MPLTPRLLVSRALCALLIALLPAAIRAQTVEVPVLYAITTNPNAADLNNTVEPRERLLKITLSTGAGAAVGTLGRRMSAFDLSVRDNELYAYDQLARLVHRLNPETGATLQTINAGNLGGTEGGFTLRADGTGFAAPGLFNSAARLLSFSLTSATPTVLGTLTVALDALAYDPGAGVLYGLDTDGAAAPRLYTVDQSSGALTLIGSLGSGVAPGSFGGLAFHPDGTLYAVVSGTAASTLYRLNKQTGAATLVGPVGFGGVSGIAFRTESQPAPGDKLTITDPDGQTLFLSQSDGRRAVVPLRAQVNGTLQGSLTWTLQLRYVSPSTAKVFTLSPAPLTLSAAESVQSAYPYVLDRIGDLTVSVSGVVDGQTFSDTATAQVRGYSPTPVAAITNYLISPAFLGSLAPTPLLAGLAESESSYTGGLGQFNADRTIRLSATGAIGLFQISLRAHPEWDLWETYSDWQVNAGRGREDFLQKLADVNLRVSRLRASPWLRNLPPLEPFQRENWALYRYKGIGLQDVYLPDPAKQYTAWRINPNLSADARRIVNRVREEAARISGDSSVLLGKTL